MKYTKQETFDRVVAHARKQGARAADGDDCFYRAPDGLQCFAGCLIPDDEYHAGMEGGTVDRYSVGGYFFGHDAGLVDALQGVHDCHEPNEWEGEFAVIADNLCLTYAGAGE